MRADFHKKHLTLRIAAVIFLLTMLSFCMQSGLFARYTATASDSDLARVASFNVNVIGNPENVNVSIGKNTSGEYGITVQNLSEVAVSYDIILILSDPLPVGTDANVGGVRTVSDDRKTLTFSNVGALAPNAEKTESLVFSANPDLFAAQGTGDSHTESRSFNVSVIVTQVD